MVWGTVWAALIGCGQEYGLSAIHGDESAIAHRPRATDPVHVRPSRASTAVESPAPPEVPVVPIHEHALDLGGGAPSAVADYLFVVDGSSSMAHVLAQVLDGFEALARDNVFPSEARIAVMSTLPADPEHRGRVHPSAPNQGWLRFEPGFGGLVDKERIARFRDFAPSKIADRFGLDGCEAWFAPGDRNADGVPCLVANTQLSLYPVVVEAGLTALGQQLDAKKPLFRSGAAVNVVFVSDTHDPGFGPGNPWFDEMERIRPTFAELERKALARQDLASFRLHAIAPAEICTLEDWSASGPVYFEAAEASGGRILDLCSAEPRDYAEVVRRIAVEGAVPQRPVVPLVAGAEVSQVLVDGVPSVFTVSRDGRAVVLPGRLPAEKHKVQVRYRLPMAAGAPISPGRAIHGEDAPPDRPKASPRPQ